MRGRVNIQHVTANFSKAGLARQTANPVQPVPIGADYSVATHSFCSGITCIIIARIGKVLPPILRRWNEVYIVFQCSSCQVPPSNP